MLNPLLLTALGRSGTTYMLSLLRAHPQIVAFQGEIRLFQAWLFPADPHCAASVKAVAPFVPSSSALTYDLVVQRYQELAAKQGKTPLFFAEKHIPYLRLSSATAAVPAGLQTIVLVRDPRDVLMSARAFDQQRGFQPAFVERAGDTDEQIVLKYRTHYLHLLAALDSRPEMPLVRYEDLISAPDEILQRVFAQLGLESDSARISSVMAGAMPFQPGHSTASSSASSIGRWRQEMPQGLRRLYDTHMGEILAKFGYENGSDDARRLAP
jgi:hypothetical protein